MDDADLSDGRIEKTVSDGVAQAQRAAAAIPAGHPGECECCGEWSERLVGGRPVVTRGRPRKDGPKMEGGNCARCRDKYGLK